MYFHQRVFVGALCVSFGSCDAKSAQPPYDPRAIALVKKMSFTEKSALLAGVGGPAIGNTAAISRLDVPALHLEDGPQGVGDNEALVTAFPCALAMAAAWDVDVAAAWGAVMGDEQRRKGMHIMLGPGLNLARVPLNGRNMEYFGEDPVLAGQVGAAVVRGIQSNGVIACAKHWVNNNQEGPDHNGRLSDNSIVGERVNFELYYAPFAATIDAGVGAIMCAYNLVNGTYACQNEPALTRDLKGRLAFAGFVMSDWGAMHDVVPSFTNGMDMSMPGGFNAQTLALLEANVSAARLDDAVVRIISQLYRNGIMEHPSNYNGNSSVNVTSAAHQALAREFAEKSMVLLKNDNGTLPLSDGNIGHVAVIGDDDTLAGTGSGHVILPYLFTLTQALVERFGTAAPKASTLVGDGVERVANGTGSDCTRVARGGIVCNHTISYQPCGMNQCDQTQNTAPVSEDDIVAATELARTSSVAIVSVAVNGGEGYDRVNLSLGAMQEKLITSVAAVQPNTVVVIRCPGAISMPWLPSVRAVLVQFLPGQESARALANVLYGSVSPEGKLPLTFPVSEEHTWLQTPEQYPGVNFQVDYTEELLMGYRWFNAKKETPLFPFGFGLSYTSFEWSDFAVEPIGNASTQVVVEVTVTNTGHMAGADVVMAFVTFPTDAGEPPLQLKAFSKVRLTPHSSERVALTITAQAVSVWSVQTHAWVKAPGTFDVAVGSSVADVRFHHKFVVQ